MWKYFTKEHHREFVLSLGLLEGIGWTDEKQLRCLYSVSNHVESHYAHYVIPKQNGESRELLAPDFILKKIQRNILSHVLEKLPVSPYATAYRKGSGVLKNASPHVKQKIILKLDICDFFGSILYDKVYNAAFPRAYYPPSVAALLTHLCCYKDALPQGAPTSAAISNLVMRPFDETMGKWCEERDIVYTRYCDDMTFSGDFDPASVIRKARNFLFAMGFQLNEKKTRIINNSQRQSVTGVVVNEKPQALREYRSKLRQEIYYCEKYGVGSHLGRVNDPRNPMDYLESLLGRIHYVLQINPQDEYFVQAKKRVQVMLENEVGGCAP